MKKNGVVAVTIALALMCIIASIGFAQDAKKSMKMEKSPYLVEAKHTPEECLSVLDEVHAKGSQLLGKFDWGCMAGEHTGYAVINAESEASLKAMLPASMANAHIVKLNKFTAEQIKSFHAKK